MTDLLIKDVSQAVADALERRARDHGRTPDAEARAILERAVESTPGPERAPESVEAWKTRADALRRQTEGRDMGDSTEIIREFRDSR